MIALVCRRLAALVPTLLIVGSIAFVLTHALPGDPAAIMLGAEATPNQVAALRTELGMGDPLLARYLAWLTDLVRGDLGTSVHHDRPVAALLMERVGPTLQLALYATTLAILVGLPAGILAAVRPGRLLDRALILLATSATAVAGFFLAMLLILLFAVHLRWFPAAGSVPLTDDLAGHLRSMALPTLALGLPLAGVPARVIRASLLDLGDAEHVIAASGRGLPWWRVLLRHKLPIALVPTITVLGYRFAELLGGAVIVETIFNLPGLGQLIATAIGQRDLVVLQGAILLVAVVFVLASLLVDLVTLILDRRVASVRA